MMCGIGVRGLHVTFRRSEAGSLCVTCGLGSNEPARVSVELNAWNRERFITRHSFHGTYSGTIPCVGQEAWSPGNMASGVLNYVTIRVTSSSGKLWESSYGIVRVIGAAPPAASGRGNSMTLVSGNGSYGGADTVVQTSLDNVTWKPATVSACCEPAGSIPGAGSDWDSIPGTKWDSNPVGAVPALEPAGVHIWFRVTFTLPATFTTPSLTVAQFVDDYDTVSLNGTPLGSALAYGNWMHTPQKFAASKASLFHPGSNQLVFDTNNHNAGPGGLDFSATVTWARSAK